MAILVSQTETLRQQSAEQAFERLFTAEYGKVVGIACHILGDLHEAEDVAQEVFTQFHGRHAADAPYAPAWLHKAAAHTAFNVIRSRGRRERRDAADFLRRTQTQPAAEAALDPQRALEEAELRREVSSALSRLPEKNATILTLRYSGLSYAEVAAALGVHINQVGTLLKRAEAALRKEIERETSR